MTYGYIRVSTKEQNTDRQRDAIEALDIQVDEIFADKQSGKNFDRPAWQKMIGILNKGDLIIVKSIDRLGRNYDDILSQWRMITKVLEADILVLDMPLLDTRAKDNDITGKLISDIVLQLLAYVAETERDSIRKRQREGIASAKARGTRFGRPLKKRPDMYDDIARLWRKNEISAREAARKLGVHHKTFLKWVRDDRTGMPEQIPDEKDGSGAGSGRELKDLNRGRANAESRT